MKTISDEEYEQLKERDNWLTCLENAGVDNWEGWDYAVDLKRECEDEIKALIPKTDEELQEEKILEEEKRLETERQLAEEEARKAKDELYNKYPLRNREIIQEVSKNLKKSGNGFSIIDMRKEYISIVKKRKLESQEFIDFWENELLENNNG
jgi:small-conductance mechanosensitive channel